MIAKLFGFDPITNKTYTDIIDTEGNEAKARELERAMLVYESYVGDVISLEIDASNTIEIAEEQKTNYEEVVRQQREIIKTWNEINTSGVGTHGDGGDEEPDPELRPRGALQQGQLP